MGTSEYQFFDSNRNRAIPSLVFYPSDIGGQNSSVASSEFGFPVVSFGHGFVIDPADYGWLAIELASEGYVVVLPQTEGQLLPAPDHLNFGLDIRFCAEELIRLSREEGNPISGKILPRYAMMGHSMGGGATYLGAANQNEVATTVTFAAANTDPSSIDASGPVSVPSLVIAAAEDCVTPVSSNQVPMYENLSNPEKAIITIVGASHCNFTDGSASLCYLGETFPCFGFGPFISRNQQHQRVLLVLKPWLRNYLYSNCSAGEEFVSNAISGQSNGDFNVVAPDESIWNCPPECSSPSNLNASIEGSGFALTWDNVPSALGYQVQVQLNNEAVVTVSSPDNELFSDQLNVDLPYQFKVRSFCPSLGLSSFSDWVSANQAELNFLLENGNTYLAYSSYEENVEITIQSLSGSSFQRISDLPRKGKINLEFLDAGIHVVSLKSNKNFLIEKIWIP